MISSLCWSFLRLTLERATKTYDRFGLKPFLSLDKLLKAFDLLSSHMNHHSHGLHIGRCWKVITPTLV